MAETEVLHHALSDRRLGILSAIAAWQADYGYCPTVREIQLAVGLATPSTIHSHLAALREDGLVDWKNGAARTLHLTPRGRLYVL